MSKPKPASDKRVVKISRNEMQEALIMYAAGKSQTKYPLKHSIELNGILTLMGGNEDDELFCTVTLEHLPNVTPIGKNK